MDCRSRENLSELASQLNNLCKDLDDQIHINWGGCCYVTYCIAKLLELDGVEFSVIVFDDEFKLMSYKNFIDIPQAMAHYAIMLGNEVNLNSVINAEEDDYVVYFKKFKTTAQDILIHYEENDWNPYYDTDNNKYVLNTIEEYYYEFTKNLREG